MRYAPIVTHDCDTSNISNAHNRFICLTVATNLIHGVLMCVCAFHPRKNDISIDIEVASTHKIYIFCMYQLLVSKLNRNILAMWTLFALSRLISVGLNFGRFSSQFFPCQNSFCVFSCATGSTKCVFYDAQARH